MNAFAFNLGFLKRPCVSELISYSSPDHAVSLGCEITDFYPPNISVTWLKLREGEEDDREEEIIKGGEIWGPLQTNPRMFRSTALLKMATARKDKDRVRGIVCRVEHCSLPEPIEKHWRDADIGMTFIQ